MLDIFAGSNTTGHVAECEGRKWLAFEERLDYLAASSFRFFGDAATDAELKAAHAAILHGKTADRRRDVFQVAQRTPQNGNVHKPPTPSERVLVLAENMMPRKQAVSSDGETQKNSAMQPSLNRYVRAQSVQSIRSRQDHILYSFCPGQSARQAIVLVPLPCAIPVNSILLFFDLHQGRRWNPVRHSQVRIRPMHPMNVRHRVALYRHRSKPSQIDQIFPSSSS